MQALISHIQGHVEHMEHIQMFLDRLIASSGLSRAVMYRGVRFRVCFPLPVEMTPCRPRCSFMSVR